MSKTNYLIDLAQLFYKRGFHHAAEFCAKLAEPEAERRKHLLDEHATKEKIKQQAKEEAQKKEKLEQLRRLKEFRDQTKPQTKPKARPMISAPKHTLVPGEPPATREEKPQKNILDYEEVPKVELAYKTEMDEAKRKAALNFIEVRKSITSFTHSVIFLAQQIEKVDNVIISYVKGEAISAIKGEALTNRTAPVVFENLKSKAGANDAVLYCENGGVKFIHPKNNAHIASDFFNIRVDIQRDLASEIDILFDELKKNPKTK